MDRIRVCVWYPTQSTLQPQYCLLFAKPLCCYWERKCAFISKRSTVRLACLVLAWWLKSIQGQLLQRENYGLSHNIISNPYILAKGFHLIQECFRLTGRLNHLQSRRHERQLTDWRSTDRLVTSTSTSLHQALASDQTTLPLRCKAIDSVFYSLQNKDQMHLTVSRL